MSDRLRMAYQDDRATLMACDRPRDIFDVKSDLEGMLAHAKREGQRPILVTDPRGVLYDDPDGAVLASHLYVVIGTRPALIIHPWVGTKAPVRIRWRTSIGQARGVWITGKRFVDHPHPGQKTRLEALMRWLPDGVILDPCAGLGDVAVAARRAGRTVLSVVDAGATVGPAYIAARLGQGMLFDDDQLITS